MDLQFYVSSAEGRLFLAVIALLCGCAFDLLRGVLLQNRTDPRPILERVAAFLIVPLNARLNRIARSPAALAMRGALVMSIVAALFAVAIGGGFVLAKNYGQGGPYQVLLLVLASGSLTWVFPLRALAASLDNPQAGRAYLALSHATYTSLVNLDTAGIIRVTCTAAVRSLLFRMAAPVVLFILFGWQAVALYWPVMTFALIAGQEGADRGFALFPNLFSSLMLIVPALVMVPVMLLALLLSAGASFFRALPMFLDFTRWPGLHEGGLTVSLVAYAMKLTLGGPRQDHAGNTIAGKWIGSDKGTARLDKKDIGRILYLQAVTTLIVAAAIYALAVFA